MKLPLFVSLVVIATSASFAAPPPNGSLLFDNLRKLGNAYRVDDPSVTGVDLDHNGNQDGPKGLASADLNGDGRNDLVASNTDGTIAVLFGAAAGGFEDPIFLQAGSPTGLRDVICGNLTGDARPEIIAAHPFDGKLYVFSLVGGAASRTFSAPTEIPTWPGARSVAAGDFNGDGKADLVVAGSGGTNGSVREFRGNGAGGFTPQVPIAAIDAGAQAELSATPVFTMHVWRKAGETRDRLVVSYASSPNAWFLQCASVSQPLAVSSTLALAPSETVYDLALGFLSAESRASGQPDLLTASQFAGVVSVRQYADGAYPTTPQKNFSVPGGPRGLSIADVNNDGWPDLLVASRFDNTLYLFLNHTGSLSLASQTAAGASPRDVVCADFNGNGLPDAAVINRDSQNVTIHLIDPQTGLFLINPAVQRFEGGASAVELNDLDGNGRPELLVLNSTTGDVSIHPFGASAQLLPATRYSMGVRPQTLATPDINRDGRPDLQCATLGDAVTAGGIKYRLQLPDHTFGPLLDIVASSSSTLPMLTSVQGDFNGDGLVDRAVLYSDCRIALLEGTPTGFIERRVESFLYEARSISTADLDHDGDLDLVGVGAYGALTYIINDGHWFTGGALQLTRLDWGNNSKHWSPIRVVIADGDADGYLDVDVFSTAGVSRWIGQPGSPLLKTGTQIPLPVSSGFAGKRDFDGDAFLDDFVISPTQTSLSFFKGTPTSNGQWWTLPSTIYTVPSSTFLVHGDIDGDNQPDLIGVGEYLWVALSGTPAAALVPTVIPPTAPAFSSLVINEVLASTKSYIAPGASSPVDCVEIYNPGNAPVAVAGWTLRRMAAAGESQKPDFIFPSIVLQPGSRTTVYCNEKSGAWQAPFKLPEAGATLVLSNAAGAEVNSIIYGRQQPDVSFSRLVDASRTLVYNPLPSIGSVNYDNGATDPLITFIGIDPKLLKSNQWRFRASAWSPSGMFALAIFWQEIAPGPNPRSGTIPLFDDGNHDDGAAQDGVFAGDWPAGDPAWEGAPGGDGPLPRGTAVQFYIRGTDLRGESATEPASQQFTAYGQPIKNFTLSIPAQPSGFEISEVLSRNQGGLTDEYGLTPDWAEIRYTGAGSVPVSGLFLSQSLFGFSPSDLYNVANQGATISSGDSHLIFLDGFLADSGASARHAPFKLNGDGDTLYLLRLLPSGATELVDTVTIPPLDPNVAYARLGVGGEFVKSTTPTPDQPNARPGGSIFIVPGTGGSKDCVFAYPGAGSVEASYDLKTWTIVQPALPDTGLEHAYREPLGTRRFFRVR